VERVSLPAPGGRPIRASRVSPLGCNPYHRARVHPDGPRPRTARTAPEIRSRGSSDSLSHNPTSDEVQPQAESPRVSVTRDLSGFRRR
jgi:hypothetical protein